MPEEGLYQAIVVRAIKDYLHPQYKQEVMDWVVDMAGDFSFCAYSMKMDPLNLRKIMVDKMITIDTYGTVTLYLNGEARMRK